MQPDQRTSGDDNRGPISPWVAALGYAVPAIVLVLGLMTYWFAIANRYTVFLYYHDMGPRVPDTRPFSPVTRSRYWMTGFVAGGAVLVLTTGISWVLGRIRRGYTPPAWWRVWLLSALPISVGILAITMTFNSPRLPLSLAAATTLTTLVALALALQPSRMAAQHPWQLALLAADGACLGVWLTALPAVEYLPYWLDAERLLWVWYLIAMLAASVIGLAILTALRWVTQEPGPGSGRLSLSGVVFGYVALPLAHHVLVTNRQFYITDMDNFFSRVVWIQVLTWATTVGLALATAGLRQSLIRTRTRSPEPRAHARS